MDSHQPTPLITLLVISPLCVSDVTSFVAKRSTLSFLARKFLSFSDNFDFVLLYFEYFYTHLFSPLLTSRVCSGDELEKIKALFNEKEKELSLAVAKVEDLTRQLDDLRTGRNGDVSTINTTTSVELEKLRNEIAVSRSCMFKIDQTLRWTRGRFLCATLTQQPTFQRIAQFSCQ